ncbi:MAG TPA: hypothetical protein VHN55_03985 [Sphingomicrobium sp.]|nr:hypothetical protein [Sphingomicrobium sp.]
MGLSVTLLGALTLIPMLFGFAGGSGVQVRSIVVEDQIIIRVPVRPTPRVEWSERKGPDCIPIRAIQGAFLSASDHVDFVLPGRRLIRAELDENCPALDFYDGFYLRSADDRVCAKRDSIRVRMGAPCRIERFRELKAKVRR